MRKNLLVIVACVLFSCGKSTVEKPDNLIKEDKMVEILYDLSILEALKSQRPSDLTKNGIDASTYIYKKYKIDSLQLAASNRYYASDLEKYREIYDKVKEKLEVSKRELDPETTSKNTPLDDTPRVE